MDKKELMAEYNRAVLFGEIYDSKPATQKGQVAVRIGRGKNAGKFFIRGGKGGASKPKATQIGSKPISEAGKPAKVKAKQPWEMTLDEYHKTQNVTGEFSKRKATREHHQSVEAAKKEGKKVSQDNLVRYGIQDADNPQTRAMEKYFAKLKQEEKAKPEPKKSSRVVGQTKDGRNIFKKSRKPSGIREKRRLAKENANEGIGELKTETNFNKRGKLINSFSMDKINDIIGHMKLQNHGSKTDKVDRILMAIDKKLPAEHRYFE